MRNIFITIGTLAMTAIVIGNAYFQKKQFYPSVVYMTKSNPSMAVLYLQAFILIWLVGKLMQKIFFGQLRAAEIEHLIERFWYAITETCLAFTVFKDDFSPKFVILCVLLLFLKTFHWLAEDRVDYMERSPIISWLFHTRIVLLLGILAILDTYFISYAYHSTITKGPSVQLVFGFEYAILLTVIINTSIKYVLHIIDMSRDVFWENKAVFLLYVEVFIGFIKVVLYVTFVGLMMKLFTLPLFAFRPMYYATKNFRKALNDVIQSRRAIHNMNTLYPDATVEELAATDNVCIICREEMQAAGTKKLPCNHIFHKSCLRSWFQRHQTCPTCRLNVLRTPTPDTRANAHGFVPPQQQQLPAMFQFAGWQPPFLPPAAAANMAQFQMPIPGAAQAPTPQNQQTDNSTNASSSTAPPNSASTSSHQQFPLPTFLPQMPSFMSGMPFPPMPPQNWVGLSTEELRQMEDVGRRGVEARLQCIRNIHSLLDASVLLMQQYVNAATLANIATSANANSVDSQNLFNSAAAAAAAAATTSNSETNTNINSHAQSTSSFNSEPNTSQTTTDELTTQPGPSHTFSTSASTSHQQSASTSEPIKTSNMTDNTDIASVSDPQLIRQRRVEKFTNSSQ